MSEDRMEDCYLRMIADLEAENAKLKVDHAELAGATKRLGEAATALIVETKAANERLMREVLTTVVKTVMELERDRGTLRDQLRWVLTAETEELDQWRNGEHAASMINAAEVTP